MKNRLTHKLLNKVRRYNCCYLLRFAYEQTEESEYICTRKRYRQISAKANLFRNNLAYKAHRDSLHNRQALQQATRCHCFSCQRTITPSEIHFWLDDETTAVCPYCQIDSIIPDSRHYTVTPHLLSEMRKIWFP